MKARASLVTLARETAAAFSEHQCWIFAGAMAAFAGLALAPLALIAVRLSATLREGHRLVRALVTVFGIVIGHEQARAAVETVRRSNPGHGTTASLVVGGIIAVTAGWRFVLAMQTALKRIWSVDGNVKAGALTIARDILVCGLAAALVTIGLFGALVAGSLVFSVARGSGDALAVPLVRAALVLGATLALVPVFAALFKLLPRTPIAWSDVWVGAAASATFFAGGQLVIGAYLALRNVEAIYGGLAAIVVVLLWLYYSAYTFLIGAEFTHVYATHVGTRIQSPDDGPD